MSFTRTVPAGDPSLFQSSCPSPGAVATKYAMPLTLVRPLGDELATPGLMSLTSIVPAAVPSLFHSSTPRSDLVAEKNSVPPTSARFAGVEPAGPGLMSFTSAVPAMLPSVFQSSLPVDGSPTAKNTTPFEIARLMGDKLVQVPSLNVPASVPSLRQSPAMAAAGPCTLKISRPFSCRGHPVSAAPPNDAPITNRGRVPAAVPSLCHSCVPVLSSDARKISFP